MSRLDVRQCPKASARFALRRRVLDQLIPVNKHASAPARECFFEGWFDNTSLGLRFRLLPRLLNLLQIIPRDQQLPRSATRPVVVRGTLASRKRPGPRSTREWWT